MRKVLPVRSARLIRFHRRSKSWLGAVEK